MAKEPKNGGKRWTAQDERQLRTEARGNTPTRVIALHLGRSSDAVASKASEMKVSLNPVNQSPYNRRK